MTALKDALDAAKAENDALLEAERLLESNGYTVTFDHGRSSPPPPAGDMVLVPREPTEAMCEAGWIDTDGVTPRDIYIKMLAAAPLPAQEVTVTKGMRRGLVAAKILLANSIACVQQHHGAKAGDPLPPWLADCQRDIAALESALRHGKD